MTDAEKLSSPADIADRLHDEARALSELSGEHPMGPGAASAMAVKFGIAGELREVLR